MSKRYEAILSAAVDLFSERGYGRTAISDIASAAGVATATIMYHFSNKERVLVESALRHFLSLNVHCRTASGTGENGLERVVGMADGVFEHVRLHAHGWTFFFRDIAPRRFPGDDESRLRIEEARRYPLRMMESLIAAGVRDGSISPCDPASAAVAVWATLMGFVWMVLFQDGDTSAMRDNAVVSLLLLLGRATAPHRLIIHAQRGGTCSKT